VGLQHRAGRKITSPQTKGTVPFFLRPYFVWCPNWDSPQICGKGDSPIFVDTKIGTAPYYLLTVLRSLRKLGRHLCKNTPFRQSLPARKPICFKRICSYVVRFTRPIDSCCRKCHRLLVILNEAKNLSFLRSFALLRMTAMNYRNRNYLRPRPFDVISYLANGYVLCLMLRP
jgi:hypothetical protein